jgi:hypothetical protein
MAIDIVAINDLYQSESIGSSIKNMIVRRADLEKM